MTSPTLFPLPIHSQLLIYFPKALYVYFDSFGLWNVASPGQDKETWDKRGAQESMGLTLAVTHSTGDMEHEDSTSAETSEER